MNPTVQVATTPNASPAFMKAIGIARIPDPKLPFSKWMKVSRSLSTRESDAMNRGRVSTALYHINLKL
jgi:hypothetical protein